MPIEAASLLILRLLKNDFNQPVSASSANSRHCFTGTESRLSHVTPWATELMLSSNWALAVDKSLIISSLSLAPVSIANAMSFFNARFARTLMLVNLSRLQIVLSILSSENMGSISSTFSFRMLNFACQFWIAERRFDCQRFDHSVADTTWNALISKSRTSANAIATCSTKPSVARSSSLVEIGAAWISCGQSSFTFEVSLFSAITEIVSRADKPNWDLWCSALT